MNNDTYRQRLHSRIPGGAHTYSRGDDQFPSNAPAILVRGEGAYVWDPSGNRYLDYGMGLRSVNIGYGNREIAEAAFAEILKGNNLTRASVTELEAAEHFCNAIPSVEMVKFAKHGSTATTAAVKLARAYTRRKYVAVPAEHPFFSFDDWFIGATALKRGIPEELSQLTLRFHYNRLDTLQALFEEHPADIAAVIMEPATFVGPEDQFLNKVKALCHSYGALFILDEMITGFRWHLQGAQTYYGVEPDICTFGKAMANGFALAALGGKRQYLSIGGIEEEGAERVFLTSTTHGAEMSALGAFMKTLEILKRDGVVDHFWQYGGKLIAGMNEISRSLGISDYFSVIGYPCSPHFETKDVKGELSAAMRTLFLQEMVNEGVLMPYIAISFAHGQEELKTTLEAAGRALRVYKKGLEDGLETVLKSKAIKPVFRKFN